MWPAIVNETLLAGCMQKLWQVLAHCGSSPWNVPFWKPAAVLVKKLGLHGWMLKSHIEKVPEGSICLECFSPSQSPSSTKPHKWPQLHWAGQKTTQLSPVNHRLERNNTLLFLKTTTFWGWFITQHLVTETDEKKMDEKMKKGCYFVVWFRL